MIFVWLAPMSPYDQGQHYLKQYVLFLESDAGGRVKQACRHPRLSIST